MQTPKTRVCSCPPKCLQSKCQRGDSRWEIQWNIYVHPRKASWSHRKHVYQTFSEQHVASGNKIISLLLKTQGGGSFLQNTMVHLSWGQPPGSCDNGMVVQIQVVINCYRKAFLRGWKCPPPLTKWQVLAITSGSPSNLTPHHPAVPSKPSSCRKAKQVVGKGCLCSGWPIKSGLK